MHELPLLLNIGVGLAAALVGGILARRFGVSTIVGYLLGGMAIGPFTPGFVGDVHAIGQLAELGVVFLMFGVGLHFSMRDLWQVRDPAIVGALVQMAVTTILGLLLALAWGWSASASLVLGLSISVASTVVLLRGLIDSGLLESRHGQVAVGWLVLEDLATVGLLLLLPTVATWGRGFDLAALAITLFKAGAFVVLMLIVGKRVVPWILLQIANTRSRELFLLLALTVALGTALGAAKLFGVSLALGAFLAGVVVSESPLSHQVGADVLPFREAFAVLFFVSVGMLVDPRYLWANAGPIVALTAVVVAGKGALALGLCMMLGQPIRTGVIVAAGLAQIGEFSFILGHSAVGLGILKGEQYSMLLAAALLSITINPLLFRGIGPAERWLERRGRGRTRRASEDAATIPREPHVVIIGCGRVGGHLLEVLRRIGVPHLVVESDAVRVGELRRLGVPVLFGDAANSEILKHARLDHARAVVITIPNDATAALAVATARELAPHAPLVARAASQAAMKELATLGAGDVIQPELEGGLAIVRQTLVRLGYSQDDVRSWADTVRQENYDTIIDTEAEVRALEQLRGAREAG